MEQYSEILITFWCLFVTLITFGRTIKVYCTNEKLAELFWSVFSRIRTEYRDLKSKTPYSAQMRENTDIFHAVLIKCLYC